MSPELFQEKPTHSHASGSSRRCQTALIYARSIIQAFRFPISFFFNQIVHFAYKSHSFHTIHQFLKTKPSCGRTAGVTVTNRCHISQPPTVPRRRGHSLSPPGEDFKNSYVYDCGGCCWTGGGGSRNGLLFLCLTINLNRCRVRKTTTRVFLHVRNAFCQYRAIHQGPLK